MNNLYRLPRYILSIIAFMLLGIMQMPAYGQLKEPEVRSIKKPLTPLDKGFHNRIGGSAFINNFGFGIGGTFGHALGPYTEFTFKTGISGIRNVTEQSFQTFFNGKTAANKYNRALGFPFLFGIKRRVFPRQITDNFRFFVAASGGPALAFLYPYIQDKNNNGYRDSRLVNTVYGTAQVFSEKKNDFFSGLGDGYTMWGAAGQVRVGVDLGHNFKRQTTLEIGYFFYYFSSGLQIMEPSRPTGYDQNGLSEGQEPFFGKQKYFGTPQIKFTFSGWW